MQRKVVYATPWFELVAKSFDEGGAPYYSISTLDYVSVIAVTPEGRLLLVRQFRAAVEGMTLELPCGHVDPGDTPEEAARKELLEETGHVAPAFELLGTFSPDPGRLGNRLWCFFAAGATPAPAGSYEPEPGVAPSSFEGTAAELLAEPEFQSALHAAALMLAVVRGRLAAGSTPAPATPETGPPG